MKHLLVIATLIGLAFTAITNSSWPWLSAVMGIALALYLARNARLTTRVQLILVAALGGGLGAEIVRTFYLVASGDAGSVGLYRHVLIVALGSAIIVLAAMIAEYLVQKLLSRFER
jgi:Na+/phosphate symporter